MLALLSSVWQKGFNEATQITENGKMTYKAECAKCGGKGEIKAFSGVAGGLCFCCNGKGYVELKNPPKRSVKFQIIAVAKDTGDRELVCWINAKNESDAAKKAISQLSRGNLYIPETAEVITE